MSDVVDSMEVKFDLSISTKIKIYTKFNSLDSSIKPGRHYLYGVATIPDLLDELISSMNIDIEVQILEGKQLDKSHQNLTKMKSWIILTQLLLLIYASTKVLLVKYW